jgi:transcriptional regulator with XRE-family HTH domain
MRDSENPTSSLRSRLTKLFRDREYRRTYVESFLNTSIAAQIKANREKRGWSQGQLAELAGMKQSRISALENVSYDSWSIKTLRRLAEAFDLVLVVRFESFGKVIEDIESFDRSTLEAPSFSDDPVFDSVEPRQQQQVARAAQPTAAKLSKIPTI